MNSRKMMTNCKRRGERAELQFMAKAARFGLGVSKPWEEFSRYDMVVGTASGFVSVQVKSTIYRSPAGGYIRKVAPSPTSKPYRLGEFDFLAAYDVAEHVWYIIPARLVIHGNRSGIRLYPSSLVASEDLWCGAYPLRVPGVRYKSNSPYTINTPTINSD
jgi:PD-(D/E)XK endonuclease